MKRILPIFLFIAIGLSPVFAQIDIVADLKSDTNFKGQDLTDSILDLSIHIDLSNLGTDIANLKWEILTSSDTCMEEWGIFVCDNNFCYDETVSTNYDPEGSGINFPSVLDPGETYDFVLHVLPYTVAGCCTVTLDFSTIEDPETIIESLELEIHVNSADCLELVAVEDPYIAALEIYPNPTQAMVQLSNLDRISSLSISDVYGNTIEDVKYDGGLDMQNFKAGIYFLSAFDKRRNLLKTFRLVKN